MTVTPALIKRCKNHFHQLPCGVSVVLGNNGYIWIGAPQPDPADPAAPSATEDVELDMREKIARVRNVILALAAERIAIFATT